MARSSKPKLGQNFLVDATAQHRIVEALGDVSQRTIIEIGPGHGVLTELLATRCRRLIAIELDPDLTAELRFRFRHQPTVEIVEANVLETGLAQYAAAGETVDVIGNLPYYITSAILLHLFSTSRGGILRRAVLMMQREVADRVTAHPGTRNYGLLAATSQLHGRAEAMFTLPPTAFRPPPDVHSTVVRLEFAPRFAELDVSQTVFNEFLKQVFAQKRKTLVNNLRSSGYSAEQVANSWPSNLPISIRAEQVSLELLANLHHLLSK